MITHTPMFCESIIQQVTIDSATLEGAKKLHLKFSAQFAVIEDYSTPSKQSVLRYVSL